MGIILVTVLMLIVGVIIYYLLQSVCYRPREGFFETRPGQQIGVQQNAARVNPNPLVGFLSKTTLQQIIAPMKGKKQTFKNPNFFEYVFDGNNMAVADGRNDMYDWGNYTMLYVDGFTSNSVDYTTAVMQTLQHNGKHIEHMSLDLSTPLMYMCKSAQRARLGFRKAGNLGADNMGQQRTDVVYNGERVNGLRVYAWRRLVFNAGDPSICDLYFAIADDTSTIHDATMYTRNDTFTDGGFSEFYMDVTNTLMGCILLSKPVGIAISVDECKESISKICKLLSEVFIKQFIATDPEDSYKCKDCMIALQMDRGMELQKAGEMVDSLLKVTPDEYLAMMGQSLDSVPKDMQAKLPAMDLNEIISQMQKLVMLDAEGNHEPVDACVVPLSMIARMLKDSPSQVRLENDVYGQSFMKILRINKMELPTNIRSSYSNDISELMKLDPSNDQMKTYGALVSVADQSELRQILIELFAHTDSETMRKINNLFAQYKITFDQRQEAKRSEVASAKQLADARAENSRDSTARDSALQAESQQRSRTEQAQQRANQATTRWQTVQNNIWSRLNNRWYFPPGV